MAAVYLSATGAPGSRRPCGAMPAKGGFLNFLSYEAGYIWEHFVKASPIRSDFRHPEPCSPRPQYRLRGGRGDAKGAGTTLPRIERSQLRPTINAARAAFAGVGPLRRKRVAWVVAPNDGVSGQLMENVLPTFWTSDPSRIFGEALPRMANIATGPGQLTTAAARRGRRNLVKSRCQKAKRLRCSGALLQRDRQDAGSE